jgi:hypothetical protein
MIRPTPNRKAHSVPARAVPAFGPGIIGRNFPSDRVSVGSPQAGVARAARVWGCRQRSSVWSVHGQPCRPGQARHSTGLEFPGEAGA